MWSRALLWALASAACVLCQSGRVVSTDKIVPSSVTNHTSSNEKPSVESHGIAVMVSVMCVISLSVLFVIVIFRVYFRFFFGRPSREVFDVHPESDNIMGINEASLSRYGAVHSSLQSVPINGGNGAGGALVKSPQGGHASIGRAAGAARNGSLSGRGGATAPNVGNPRSLPPGASEGAASLPLVGVASGRGQGVSGWAQPSQGLTSFQLANNNNNNGGGGGGGGGDGGSVSGSLVGGEDGGFNYENRGRRAIGDLADGGSGLDGGSLSEEEADWGVVRDFKFEDLTLIKRIGGGSFSQVFEGELKEVGHCAVKILMVKDDNRGTLERIKAEMQREVALLVKLEHVNIVKFIGQVIQGTKCCIIMELAEYGSLHDLLYVQSKVMYFNKERKFSILKGIVAGVAYLHAEHIIHRDIKPENVLIGEDYVPKLTDFNVSVQRDIVSRTQQGTAIGTCLYMAPELFESRGVVKYSCQADVYSISMLMVDLFTHTRPFHSQNFTSEYAIAEAVKNNVRPELPEGFDHRLESFMWKCWHMEPRERPTSSQMLKWLNKTYP